MANIEIFCSQYVNTIYTCVDRNWITGVNFGISKQQFLEQQCLKGGCLCKPSVSFMHLVVCNFNSKECYIFEPGAFQRRKTHLRNSNAGSKEQ